MWCNQALPKRVKRERKKEDRKVQRDAKRGERPSVCGSVRIPARVGRLVERGPLDDGDYPRWVKGVALVRESTYGAPAGESVDVGRGAQGWTNIFARCRGSGCKALDARAFG